MTIYLCIYMHMCIHTCIHTCILDPGSFVLDLISRRVVVIDVVNIRSFLHYMLDLISRIVLDLFFKTRSPHLLKFFCLSIRDWLHFFFKWRPRR